LEKVHALKSAQQMLWKLLKMMMFQDTVVILVQMKRKKLEIR